MKIFRRLAFFFSLLLLCPAVCGTGCARRTSGDPQELLKHAAFITAADGDLLFTLELTDGGGIFRFSAPELLKELTVTVEGEALTAAYGDLETEVSAAFLAGVFPLYQAVCAFRTEEAERKGNENILSVSLDGTVFLLYYDSGSGTVTRLETQVTDGVRGFDILSCLPPE